MPAVGHEIVHEFVVGNRKVGGAAEAGARVDDEIQQRPFFGHQDIFFRILGRIRLVHRLQQILGNLRKTILAAEITVNHPRRRWGVRVDDLVFPFLDPFHLAEVMVETEVNAFHVWQVGADIADGDGNPAMLHVVGLDKQHVIDHGQFV